MKLKPYQLKELHELTPDREHIDIHEYFKSKRRKAIMKARTLIEQEIDYEPTNISESC